MSHRLVAARCAAVALVLFLFPTWSAASNEGLVKLLEVLRSRGTITDAEQAEILGVVGTDSSAPASTGSCGEPSIAPGGPREPDVAPAAIAGEPVQTPEKPEKPAAPADDGAWYRRFSLRGYTQFRISQNIGDPVEVPADRSANDPETFIIRRGRLVLSGDVTDRMSLYAQYDMSASTGATDFSLQLRDLYADVFLNPGKNFRVRLGQMKIPYGWVNMQSSQNRAGLERPEGINSAAETERDLGAFLMWNSTEARARFRELANARLKGSGDYGVVALGMYDGQGPNRTDQNGQPHLLARVSYPFKLASGQFFELGAQGYSGRFVSPTQAVTVDGASITPRGPAEGARDQRIGVTAIWYPQPLGIEAEWNVGRGPELSADRSSIESRSLNGGYVQVGYRKAFAYPFTRWNYFDGARKFARNAPRMEVNEVDFGVELAKWAELEATVMYTHTFRRTRTSLFPYAVERDGNRFGFQLQWNY